MKPNIMELCEIISKCLLNSNYSVQNKLHIQDILNKYSNDFNIESQNLPQLLDDMRTLGSTLLELMIQPIENKSNQNRKKSSFNGKHLIISMGKYGILWIGEKLSLGNEADTLITNQISSKYIEMKKIENIINTNGAGDSFCVGVISNILNNHNKGLTIESINEGLKYAERVLTSSS